ncbi:SecY protein transport family protein [Trifolium repens]|nr:SecY protein transport family protein [Trifolium repens]
MLQQWGCIGLALSASLTHGVQALPFVVPANSNTSLKFKDLTLQILLTQMNFNTKMKFPSDKTELLARNSVSKLKLLKLLTEPLKTL